jgi:acetyltransferase-like isoleucine patch superfamily enzyme
MSSALPEKERAVKRGTIIIEDEVYIGPHCTITIPQRGPDAIRIGKGSVIGAYSYIDHDVPPDTVTHPVQITVETKRGEEGQGHPIVDLPTDLTRQLLQYLTERGFLKLAEKTSIH